MTHSAASFPAPRQTVFRRRVTSNFTVLGNAVLFDARLELDEGMAIVKLLAKPHDWQIHPTALRKEWRVGRGVYYRIINKLIRLGYITRGEMIKDAWGRFIACEYIVTDEPDAPPAEVADAGEIADADDEIADDAAADSEDAPASHEPMTLNVTPVASLPQSGFPHAGEPHTENRHVEKELRDNKQTPPLPPTVQRTSAPDADAAPAQPRPPDSEVVAATASGPPLAATDRVPIAAAAPLPAQARPAMAAGDPAVPERVPDFEEFVAEYRPERQMSSVGARRRWLRLKDRDRIDALAFLGAFRDDRTRRKWKMPDMRRYLLDMHWVDYAKAAREKPTSVPIKPYSAQWYRWREYRIATGQSVKFFDHYPTQYRNDWSEPSEWPPPLPPKEHRAGQTPPASSPPPHEDRHGT